MLRSVVFVCTPDVLHAGGHRHISYKYRNFHNALRNAPDNVVAGQRIDQTHHPLGRYRNSRKANTVLINALTTIRAFMNFSPR